jgi:hypothetical protein
VYYVTLQSNEINPQISGIISNHGNRGSSFNIMTRLRVRRVGFDYRQRYKIFLLTASRPSLGPLSLLIGTTVSFPGGKATGQ